MNIAMGHFYKLIEVGGERFSSLITWKIAYTRKNTYLDHVTKCYVEITC
jgi:hypothetical protein